ncbi:uncharacterized protein LOC135469581 [Liolophura sinensis]|uniref:uncharacterized protein LOC135469581 n=1 Tax=Liolophura sinensis TaxID=3198878 RepID=UPI003159445C
MKLRLIFLAFLLGVVGYSIADTSSVLRVLQRLRTNGQLSDEDRKVLALAKEDDLPEPVKRMVTTVAKGANTCCRNVPTSVVTKSRSSKRVTTHRSNYRAGSSHCGLWGWRRCARYENRYREVVTYAREYYKQSVEAPCPEKDVVCCHLFINVSGRCVNIHNLSSVTGKLVG